MHTLTPYFYLKNANKLPSKKTVIFDLGCRDGRQLVNFYNDGYQIVGMDKDVEQIRIARLAMPDGNFYVDDIRRFSTEAIPQNSFVILRNVLPFFESKEQVREYLHKFGTRPIYFTLFGKNDELPHSSLWWEREEVDKLCRELGASLLNEFEGMSKNLAGNPRRTHIFYCCR